MQHESEDEYCGCSICTMNNMICRYILWYMKPTDRVLLPVGMYDEMKPG
jgi:hypothetical protein